MGQSTDAILCYGINIEDGSDQHEACEALSGDDHYEALEAAEKELGVELVGHCSGDYRMYIIGTHKTRAWRGDPKEIDPASMVIDEKAARAQIRTFCERFKLSFSEDACKWWLASD